jgi:hypothetical protein
VTKPALTADAVSDVDGDVGVVGNSRLTSSTGIVLTILLLIEGFTILDVRGYITLHTVLGLMLIGPVALKCGTTIYRFVRYYSGTSAYVRRGAPHILLRVMGPFVIVSSLAVIGTGVALLVDHGNSDSWLTLHQASFIVWVALTGLHFLLHLYEAVRQTGRDLRRGSDDPAAHGRAIRLLTVAASLVIGLAIAAAFTPSASSWQLHRGDHGRVSPAR